MVEVIAIGSEPSRRGPLDGVVLPASDALSVSLLPPAARMILRGGAELRIGLQSATSIDLPSRPNRAAMGRQGSRAAPWLSPDEWLLLAPGEEPAAVRTTIADVLSKHAHSLVDISHRQIALELTGRLAVRVLSAGCPLDLRLAAFPAGMATRTLFAKAEIVLWRRTQDRFHIEVWRSFASYLAGHLMEAMAGAPGP